MSYDSPSISVARTFHRYRDAFTRGAAARVSESECPTCLGQHEDEIHSATVRVHRWFRSEVSKAFSRRPVG